MKKIILLIAVMAAVSAQSTSFGQRRPVKKPVNTATPAPTPKPAAKAVSPAEGFFNDGLKCDAKDFDCQVSNYTKAINLQLNTKAVFQKRAAAYMGREDFEKAIADLTKVIELDLNDATGFKDRGKAYLGMPRNSHNIQGAIKDFTSALDLEPKDVEAYRLRGSTYLKLGMSDKGIADIDKALLIEPDNIDLNLIKVKAFLSARDLQKAIAALSKVITLRPNDPELYTARGNVYQSLGNADKAVADFEKAIGLKPDNLDAQLDRANAFVKGKEYAKAIEAFNKLILANPQNASLYEGRGSVFQKRRKLDLAERDFRQAINLRPGSPEAVKALGIVLESQFKFQDSIEVYSRAIALNPQSGYFYFRRSEQHLKLGNFGAAIKDLDKVMELAPNFAEAYESRCWIDYHSNLGTMLLVREPATLASNCGKAIRLSPRSEIAYYVRGALNYGAKEDIDKAYTNAVANATDVLIKDPDDVEALLKRGNVYLLIGSYDKAFDDFNRAIELDPASTAAYEGRATGYALRKDGANFVKDIAKSLETSRTGAILSTKFRPPNPGYALAIYAFSLLPAVQADAFYSELINSNPDNINLYLARGIYYESTVKDLKKAFEDYERAVRLYKPTEDFFVNEVYLLAVRQLASTYMKQKNKAGALAVHDKAVELLPNNAHAYYDRADFVDEFDRARAISDYQKAADLDIKWRRRSEERIEGIYALDQTLKEIKDRNRGSTVKALLAMGTGAVDALAKSKSSSSTQSPTPTRQTATASTTNPSSGNASPAGQSGQRNGSDSNILPKGRFVGNGLKSEPQNCVKEYYPSQTQHCWGGWTSSPPFSQVQFRVLGPILQVGNVIDDMRDEEGKGKKTYRWQIQFKNLTNSVVAFDFESVPGDNRAVNGTIDLAPGGSNLHIDTLTFSPANTLIVRVSGLKSCNNYSRVSEGYVCN